MPWVRIDDAFYDHPKWIKAGPLAGWLGICGLAWCNRNLTDGFIPAGKVQILADFGDVATVEDTEDPTEIRVGAWRVSPYELAARLVDLGLWERADGGYLVHGYLRYQKSAEQIREIAVKRAESGRKGGLSKPEANGEHTEQQNGSKTEAKPEPQPQPQSLSYDKEVGAPNGAARTRGTRIPDTFEVTSGMVEWAGTECPDVDWQLATKTFVAHWKAESRAIAVKRDWTSAWRKWLLKDQGDRRRGPARTHL